jgi:hypothetical protein
MLITDLSQAAEIGHRGWDIATLSELGLYDDRGHFFRIDLLRKNKVQVVKRLLHDLLLAGRWW